MGRSSKEGHGAAVGVMEIRDFRHHRLVPENAKGEAIPISWIRSGFLEKGWLFSGRWADTGLAKRLWSTRKKKSLRA